MVGGFNHNFSYKGQTYHVQTEDSGVPRAHITTLLYRAGTVIARDISDYSDICTQMDLPLRVEQMMKEQHRAMLKNLKDGEFDAKIAQLDSSSSVVEDMENIAEVDAHKIAADENTPSISRLPGSSSEPDARTEPLEGKVKAYLDAGR
ncbi:MAG: hypothetical protein R6V18_06455 [Desulfuromonadaceae bacterium]